MAGKNVNPIQSYQEATNQLLALNAQRRSNLAEAKAEELSEAARNNTLAQAAEFVSSQGPQGTTQATDATFNPATQNILKQYGLGQPKIQKSSSSSQQVTKQNIVINNKNTNITNNNVQVPANTGGPIQGRPVQFQDPSQIKFKSWVQNAFAQQNEIAEKRKREYEKRDSNLIRSANKLMKKLEETGKSVASSMNPKNMASSMGNQLKTLLRLFGFAYIAKNWPKILNGITKIEKNVIDLKNRVVSFFTDEGGGLTKLLGGKDNEKPFEALKNLFLDKDDGILAYVKKWLNDKVSERGAAIKNIEKPNLSGWDILKNPGPALERIIGYLGDILGAIVDPSKQAGKTTKETAKKEANTYLGNNSDKLGKSITVDQRDISGKKVVDENGNPVQIMVSQGEQALLKPTISSDYYGGLLNESVNAKTGNLKNTAGAGISQGNALDRIYNTEAKSGNIQTASAATGLTRLYNSAKANKSVILSGQTLKHFLSDEDIDGLNLKKTEGYYVSRPKTDLELAMDYAREIGDEQLLNHILGFSGAMIGGAIGTLAGPVGSAAGYAGGAIAGEKISQAILKARKSKIPKETTEIQTGKVLDLTNGKKLIGPVEEDLYELNEDQVKSLIRKITQTSDDVDISLDNSQFVSAVEKSLLNKNKSGNIKRDIDIDKVYAANIMQEQHNQERAQKWEDSRAHTAKENISQKAREVRDRFRSEKANTRVANFTIHTNPSNINSGDISGVIRASKLGYFYSNTSDNNGEGKGGEMGSKKHGYIPLGKDLKGFMHKCTSGPSTFYHDGTSNKLELNGLWWDTKSPKTATGTRIGEAGFQHVWSGTREQGYNTASIEKTGFKLQPGDIMLNFGYGKKGPSSHAQMWNGEQWVSDTYQRDRSFVYGKGRLGDESAQIWRYDRMMNTNQYANAQKADSETEQTGLLAADDFEEDTNAIIPEVESPEIASIIPEGESVSPVLPTTEKINTQTTTSPTNYTPSIPFYNPNKATDITFTPETPSQGDKTNYLSLFNQQKAANFTDAKKDKSRVVDYTIPLNNMSSDLATLNQISGVNAEQLEGIRNTIAALSSQISSIGSKQSTPNTPWAVPFTQPNSNT